MMAMTEDVFGIAYPKAVVKLMLGSRKMKLATAITGGSRLDTEGTAIDHVEVSEARWYGSATKRKAKVQVGLSGQMIPR